MKAEQLNPRGRILRWQPMLDKIERRAATGKVTLGQAVAEAGIAYSTFWEWRKRRDRRRK